MTAALKRLSTGDKIRLAAPVLVYAILAFVAWKLGYFQKHNVAAAAGSSESSISVGAVFLLIYGVVGALALPVGPLAYAAGAVFGFWLASALIWLGSMLAVVAGYYLARGIWAEPARRLFGRYEGKLHGLRSSNVFLTAFRWQLMPITPFGAVNYAAAISRLSPLPFFLGTAFGIIPGTLLAAFIGDQLAAGVYGKGKTPYLFAAAGALLMLGLSFAPQLWATIHKALRSR